MFTRSHTDYRHRVKRPLGLAVALFAVVAMIASCTPDDGGGGSGTTAAFNLNAQLTSTGFDLSWQPTPVGQANGYQLQVLQTKPASGSWVDVPTATDGNGGFEPSATFTDVTDGYTYMFRVRDAGTAGAPWSQSITAWFVELTLPVMRINTQDYMPVVQKDTYISGSFTLDPNGSSYPASSGTLQIRGRGNSTWAMPKKPYKLKLDSKTALMGLTKSKKFELLANYFDKSQLRTDIAAQISNMTDLAWTPSYRHVELVLNGQYLGIDQVAEKGDVGSDRVNITEMTENDNSGDALTGGYLMEIDGRYAEKGNPGFNTNKNVTVAFDEPDPPTAAQKEYIKNYVQQFENVLMAHNFDPNTGYPKYLDVDAFIDHWIVQEVTRNQDAFWSSTYFSKDRNSDKLVFGPIWDFDNSMGNPLAVKALDPEGWEARIRGPWTYPLFRDPVFVEQANTRLAELAPRITTEVGPAIQDLYDNLEDAIPHDEIRWNYTSSPQDTPTFLTSWLNQRVAWMTTTLSAELAAMN